MNHESKGVQAFVNTYGVAIAPADRSWLALVLVELVMMCHADFDGVSCDRHRVGG